MPGHSHQRGSMSNLPPLTDHAFMRLVRKRCEDMSRSMAEIAAELGCTPDELCRWIMAYREPRKDKAYVNRDSGPIFAVGSMAADPGTNARRFSAWRKAQAGAAATRRMLELSK